VIGCRAVHPSKIPNPELAKERVTLGGEETRPAVLAITPLKIAQQNPKGHAQHARFLETHKRVERQILHAVLLGAMYKEIRCQQVY
jgi:hypothetical protein